MAIGVGIGVGDWRLALADFLSPALFLPLLQKFTNGFFFFFSSFQLRKRKTGMENILQTIINTTLNVIKFFEEKTKSAKTIKGMKRSIQFDEVAQAPYFDYIDEEGRRHKVWFEDARSIQSKLDLVDEYNLRALVPPPPVKSLITLF